MPVVMSNVHIIVAKVMLLLLIQCGSNVIFDALIHKVLWQLFIMWWFFQNASPCLLFASLIAPNAE